MANQVVLTFAGDTKKLDSAFDRVGASARKMGDDVGRSVESLGTTVARGAVVAGASIGAVMAPALAGALAGGVLLALGGGFLVAGIIGAAQDPGVKSAFGEVGKTAKSALAEFSAPFRGPLIRAAGTFSDAIKSMQPTLNEVGKTLAPLIDKIAPALAQMATNALPGIAQGAKDSAPAFEALAGFLPTVGTWIGRVVTTMAGMAAWAAANKDAIGQWISVLAPIVGVFAGIVAVIRIWTAAQAALNIVMALNPIGLVVIAVVALVAIIVIIATRTTWFQRLWKTAWGGIKSAAEDVWNWLRKVPGWMGTAFGKIAAVISNPFRSAFNGISRAWNATIGGLSWSVPGWIPGIGGNTVSVPRLPTYHAGGIVPGVIGTAVPIMAQAGERVTGVAGGGGRDEWIRVDMGELGDALLSAIARAVGNRGGSVTALGVRVVNGTVR